MIQFVKRILSAAVVMVLCGVVPLWADVFYQKDGVALRGYDPVGYFTDGHPVKGSSQFPVIYQGSLFHFSSAAHRDAFLVEPARYAPQYGGYCAYGAANGYKAKSHPDAFSIVDGKLYLNYSVAVRELWQERVSDYIAKADANWPTVSRHSRVVE